MQYLEFTFTTSPTNEAISDVLSAVLAEVGFESFVHTDELDRPCVAFDHNFPESPIFADKSDTDTFKAYIQEGLYDADALEGALLHFPLPDVKVTYEQVKADNKNWNEEWEKHYFRPLVLGDETAPHCVVAATFHTDAPRGTYNITINPQMSFGTGHHQTTRQMLERIDNTELQGKSVLDMGCGTGILAIFARMKGAATCVAVDFDEWCVRNSEENIALNDMTDIAVRHGDASVLNDYTEHFDVVLANINRNILLNDLPQYVASMRPHGVLYMSGFFTEDVPLLRERAEALGLIWMDERSLDNWGCLAFVKQ